MSALEVLFICSGNTCRSPLAEIMAAARNDTAQARFGSAGLDAYAGCPATAESCDQASERGLDLLQHRSRHESAVDLTTVDWVIGMTASHIVRFRERYPDHAGKLGLLGRPGVDLSDEGDLYVGEQVEDPYRRDTHAAYVDMAEQVERLLAEWEPTFRGGEET